MRGTSGMLNGDKPRTGPGLVRTMMLMANAKAAIAERWLSGCLRECAL